jgi:hypothetical protein
MIAYIDEDNNVCACTLMSSVPEGITGHEVDAPIDKEYRSAWSLTNGVLGYDMAKAIVEAHDKRRAKRAADFAPHDAVIALNIPAQDSERAAAETARVTIRNVDGILQSAIDAVIDIDELKAINF